MFPDLVEVLLRSAELASADRSSKNEHRDEEAEERDLSVADRSLDLARSPSSQAPLGDRHFSEIS